jgi:predicted ATPase/DNA-binding XRE family transcriptional regulator
MTKGEAINADRLPDRPIFSDLLRAHRLAAGLSQEALAERAGLSRRGISDLERGARTHPYRETLKLLVAALELEGQERRAFLAAARAGASEIRRAEPFAVAALPVPASPLIGRAEAVAEAIALLRDPAVRLVTLTGAGGSGKTRLAIEIAAHLASDFPDGVVFVDLAPLADTTLVPGAIAAALRVRERPGHPLGQTLGKALGARRLLLIPDNFEHLLPAAAIASELLAAAPHLKILATSRARLELAAEQEFPVPPLAVPDPDRLPPLGHLGDIDAVRLFVERARRLAPNFALTAENAPAIAEICRRLDGLPLALELAAARVKILPPQALVTRLERTLPLLTGGARDVPARQRTLRDTIAWSHDLLSPDGRRLLRRLGVFVGGWTLEAAEAVANPDRTLDVLDGLSSLVDQSLVRIVASAGSTRFAMLETIREFAGEQLGQNPAEEEGVRAAHAAYYADLAIAMQPGLSFGQPGAIRQAREEESNLRAALTYLLDSGDEETALWVVGSLYQYWLVVGGHFGEGRAWLERALSNGGGASPAAQIWGLHATCMLAMFQGDVVEAQEAALASRALAHGTDDPRVAVLGPLALSIAKDAIGQCGAAVTLGAEAVAAARVHGDPSWLGWSLFALAAAQWRTGDLDAATATFTEALALFRGLGSDWGEADVLMMLAGVARTEGDLGQACQLHAESLRIRQAYGEMIGIYDDLVGLAAIARAVGRCEAAARLLGAEATFCAMSGYEGYGVTPELREETRQAIAERLGDAAFRRAWDEGRTLSTEQAIAEAVALAEEMTSAAGRSGFADAC